MDKVTDEQLVVKYLAGERESLDLLIKRYLSVIYNYVLSFTKDQAAAEDLTQEVFVKVWKKIKKYNNQYKFKNWLYAVARNTSLDYLKKNKAVPFSELDNNDDEFRFEELIAAGGLSVNDELEKKLAAENITSAIDKLPKKYRQTVKLHFFSGYKFREIAEILKESIETIKSRNRRALLYLRKIMKK